MICLIENDWCEMTMHKATIEQAAGIACCLLHLALSFNSTNVCLFMNLFIEDD